MRPKDPLEPEDQPQTRRDLEFWVRDHLDLRPEKVTALMAVIDAVFNRHERLWQESKQEAIQALSAGFAEKMNRLKYELSAKEVTVSSISHYFEQLVADLTEKTHRDPKTKLMNFGRFTEQLESFLALEQRGRWCAVGLVDIHGFKWYNDALGHAVGDRIIERVAQLLREQARSDDLIAQERLGGTPKDLHARLGGDEFCFMIPDLAEYQQAYTVGERFRDSVERFDWTLEDPRLAAQPVRVDVGVVCLWLGRVTERRAMARKLAASLIQRADKLMYDAKGERANHIYLERVCVLDGELAGMPERPDIKDPQRDDVSARLAAPSAPLAPPITTATPVGAVAPPVSTTGAASGETPDKVVRLVPDRRRSARSS